MEQTKKEKALEQLRIIIKRLDEYYNHPLIAPNGKLEGMCLCIRGLEGIRKTFATEK